MTKTHIPADQRRGSSGALIAIGAEFVAKYDHPIRTGTRVREQGLWLRSYPHKNLPRVNRIFADGYEMEKLVPLNVEKLTAAETLEYLDLLRKTRDEISFGSHQVRGLFVKPDLDAVVKYIGELKKLRVDNVTAELTHLAPKLNWAMNLTWTHGDAILDNVLIRPGTAGGDTATVVIGDVIPPTPAIPSIAAVDNGRIIQSAAGYEQLRYGFEVPGYDWRDAVNTMINRCATESSYDGLTFMDAARLTLFYAVIHMLRGLRTAPVGTARDAIRTRTSELLEEFKAWMR